MPTEPTRSAADPVRGQESAAAARPEPTGSAAETTRKPALRLISGTDLLVLLGLVVLTPLAWILPPRTWRGLGGFFAPLAGRVMARQTRESVARIREIGGGGIGGSDKQAETIQDALMSGYVEDILHVLREHRPGRWRPETRVSGGAHIDAALADGSGAILWISHFSFYSLAGKIALAHAGYAVSHLSHPRHGFSTTRFGMAVLNPVRNRAEDRYLTARVFLGLESSRQALDELARRLAANEIVSITAREAVRRPLEVPFLGGRIGFAAGAPDLAWKTGAALLPVHVLARGGDSYEVVVEPAIEVDRALDRGEAYVRMAEAYAAGLARHVLAAPGQWRGWHYH